MANEKISAMPSATALAGPELVAMVQSGVNVSGTPTQLKAFALGAVTITAAGVTTFPAAGALSASSVSFTGAPITTGGNGTTTFPLVYINSGAAPTTFSTAGTMLGVNAPSGFTGNLFELRVNGVAGFNVASTQVVTSTGGFSTGANNSYSWSARGILTSSAAGNVQLGTLDAAAPVAQTLSAQSVVAATSNTAGQNLTIQGSRSTGNATGGSVIIATSPAGSTGTAQNAATTDLTISPSGVTIASGKSLTLGNAATTGLTAGVLAATTNASIVLTDSTGQAYRIPCII